MQDYRIYYRIYCCLGTKSFSKVCFYQLKKILAREKLFLCLYHWVKSVPIQSFSGPYFPAFRMQENRNQKNSKYGHFSYTVFHFVYETFQVQ